MSTVTQTVNFIQAEDLNHRQFQSFMREIDSEFADIPHHTDVFWLSRGVFELGGEMRRFKPPILRDEKWKCDKSSTSTS